MGNAEILWNFTPRMSSQMPDKENTRVLNEQRGRRAENIAAMFLRLKGYTILDRRYRTPFGEIDIIARRGKIIVFVEVKARRDHENARASLTNHQMKRIIAAAKNRFAQENFHLDTPCHFDMITVSHYLMPRHYPNVFEDTH